MKLSAGLVATTIFSPKFLQDYYDNFKTYGHLDQVKAWVIPDRKTPRETYEECARLSKEGWKIYCPDIEEQEAFLKKVGLEANFIPYNSDNRRNVGYLMALESGVDFILSIDDDNYCRAEEDFFEAHSIVCRGKIEDVVSASNTGWLNIVRLMNAQNDGPIYARGMPYDARHKTENITENKKTVNVHLNGGLWLEEPDLDAISWLVNPSRILSFKGKSVILDDNTWSPLNTQNTGLRREAVAAYYFVKMKYPVGGFVIDRYGDIFSGYFAIKCAKHLDGAVRFGTPLANHRRNNHNYMLDATMEWGCILVLEDLLPWLTQGCKLSGSNYVDAYLSLSEQMRERTEKFEGRIWIEDTKKYFREMTEHMKKWALVCKKIN